MNILIVDDNRDLADGYALLLEDEGYQVRCAYSGEAGWAIFAQQAFDLVLLDVRLPDMNGVALMTRMRQRIPVQQVIMMSGYRTEQLLGHATNGNALLRRTPIGAAELAEALDALEDGGLMLLLRQGHGELAHTLGQLEAQGRQVRFLSKPGDVLEEQEAYDKRILVLDWHLPLMRGLESYLALRAAGRVAPTVLLLDDPGSGTMDVLRTLEHTGCLFKPFDPVVLMDVVAELAAAQEKQGARA